MGIAKQVDSKYLKSLVAAVSLHLDALDKVMQGPSTPKRGKKVAALCNALEMENDRARYFGLGVNWRKDKKPRLTSAQSEKI